MILEFGARYSGTVHVDGFFESHASNSAWAEKIGQLVSGLAAIVVTGSGHDRVVEATWNKPTAGVDLPTNIRNVRRIS